MQGLWGPEGLCKAETLHHFGPFWSKGAFGPFGFQKPRASVLLAKNPDSPEPSGSNYTPDPTPIFGKGPFFLPCRLVGPKRGLFPKKGSFFWDIRLFGPFGPKNGGWGRGPSVFTGLRKNTKSRTEGLRPSGAHFEILSASKGTRGKALALPRGLLKFLRNFRRNLGSGESGFLAFGRAVIDFSIGSQNPDSPEPNRLIAKNPDSPEPKLLRNFGRLAYNFYFGFLPQTPPPLFEPFGLKKEGSDWVRDQGL